MDGDTDILGDGLHGEAGQAGDGEGGGEPGQRVKLWSIILGKMNTNTNVNTNTFTHIDDNYVRLGVGLETKAFQK